MLRESSLEETARTLVVVAEVVAQGPAHVPLVMGLVIVVHIVAGEYFTERVWLQVVVVDRGVVVPLQLAGEVRGLMLVERVTIKLHRVRILVLHGVQGRVVRAHVRVPVTAPRLALELQVRTWNLRRRALVRMVLLGTASHLKHVVRQSAVHRVVAVPTGEGVGLVETGVAVGVRHHVGLTLVLMLLMLILKWGGGVLLFEFVLNRSSLISLFSLLLLLIFLHLVWSVHFIDENALVRKAPTPGLSINFEVVRVLGGLWLDLGAGGSHGAERLLGLFLVENI